MTKKKTTKKKLTPTLLEELRNKFVHGIEDNTGGRKLFTIDQLAEDYNVAKATLYRNANKEDWKGQQQIFQDKYLAELDVKRRKELAQESVNFDRSCIQIARALLGQVGKVIQQNASPDAEVKPQHLVALSNTAVNAQRVAKLALGEATDNMNLNANVKDTETFREALELLDSIAEGRREENSESVH